MERMEDFIARNVSNQRSFRELSAVGFDSKRQPFRKCMLVTASSSILSYHLATAMLSDRH
jgi:hypothetical protein